MAKKSDRKPLGRGLSALLGESGAVSTTATGADRTIHEPTRIAIDLIRPNPDQPRQSFQDDDLQDLARSLKKHGVIQPVLLRPDPGAAGKFQIIAGERRWRAAQIAGVHELPAVVRDDLNESEVLQLAIIENVQRVDLDPIEEARGYSQLIETHGYTQEQLAAEIGKSRSHLTNMMRLLTLPDRVLEFLKEGKITAGHARALIKSHAPIIHAEKVAAEGLSVRQTEILAKQEPGDAGSNRRSAKPEKDADTRQLEGDLGAAIGMKVNIEHKDKRGAGELRISYKSLDQLDALCQKLTD